MRLEALLRSAGLDDPVEGGDPEVGRVAHDSRVVVTGDLFCCVPGDTHDGHDFAEGAVTARAAVGPPGARGHRQFGPESHASPGGGG